MVCRYAAFFRSQHVTSEDVVAIYLTNSPEFLFAWLALLAIGAIPALVNYNIEGPSLKQCIVVARAKLLLHDVGFGCNDRIQSIQTELELEGIKVMALDADLRRHINGLSCSIPNAPPTACPSLAIMYTSGSTGMSKAMTIGMQRAYCTASVSFKTFGQRPGPGGDRSYYCIPLYHGTGGLAALIDLMGGLSIAIAPKFSVSGFWKDCIDSKATIALYVGEILRYLIAAPPLELDRKHRIRLLWGNGLRPDVWTKFQERFGVPEIGEFFASTEGMLTLVNHSRNDFTRGAVGQQGWISRLRTRDDYVSVQIDLDAGDHVRDPSTGLARVTPLDEGGEILIRVADRNSWRGYMNAQEATNQKFVVDIREKGDLYYRSGDALRRSPEGLWYFLDRLGDTYRWKGENVSTTEVAEVIGHLPSVAEVCVYGVTIPGHEGRAGCAAIRLCPSAKADHGWSSDLLRHLRASLPAYAVPVFIRIVSGELLTTGNHKVMKGAYQREGVDPKLTGKYVPTGHKDEFFYSFGSSEAYQPYGPTQWKQLEGGIARL